MKTIKRNDGLYDVYTETGFIGTVTEGQLEKAKQILENDRYGMNFHSKINDVTLGGTEMENLKIKIQNEYKMYVKNFMKNNTMEDLFEDRAGHDIAIARAFKDYFEGMIQDKYDMISNIVEMANKVEMNLFDFVIESFWEFDNTLEFVLFKECRKFLKELR